MVSTLEAPRIIEPDIEFGKRNVLQLDNKEGTLGRIIKQSFYPPDYPDGIDVIGYRGREKRVDEIISRHDLTIKYEPDGRMVMCVCMHCHERGTPDELPKPDVVINFYGEIMPDVRFNDSSEGLCRPHVKQKIQEEVYDFRRRMGR